MHSTIKWYQNIQSNYKLRDIFLPAEGGAERFATNLAGRFARDFASLFNNYCKGNRKIITHWQVILML